MLSQAMSFLLVYGSQTGQSEAIADQIALSARDLKLEPTVTSAKDLDISLLQEQVVVFVVSSTGEGDPPDNFEEFWTKINEKPLPDLDYTLLGLGDSNYTEFGGFPTSFHKFLQSCGCRLFYEFALADDAVGLELVVEPWIEDLWEPLQSIIQTKSNNRLPEEVDLRIDDALLQKLRTDKTDDLGKPKTNLIFSVDYTNVTCPLSFPDGVRDFLLPFAEGQLEKSQIISIRRLSAESDLVKSTYEFVIRTTEQYSAGDSFGVLCENNDTEVMEIISHLAEREAANPNLLLNLTPDPAVKPRLIPKHILRKASTFYTLKYLLDIRSLPKKAFLKYLSESCSDPEEARTLAFLGSALGSEDLNRIIYNQGLSLLEILHIFPSCRPSVVGLSQFLPRLMPRYYSVSRIQDGMISFVFSLVESTRRIRPPLRGVCTSYLVSRSEGDIIYVYRRRNTDFRPVEARCLVMIGAGSGVSPYLGFLDHITANSRECSTVTLVTGNRYKALDSIYREEFHHFVGRGVLTSYFTAQSRDEGSKHRYVQDVIRDYADSFVEKLEEGAVFYVCGDAKGLGVDVYSAFKSIIARKKQLSEEDAEEFMMQKKRQKLYLEDIWS